jgi:NADH-quinone oxidoreductase subunit N
MVILLISALLGVSLLALEIFKLRRWMMPLMVMAFLAIIGGTFALWGMNENVMMQGMIVMDAYALRTTAVLTILALFWLLTQHQNIEKTGNSSDLYALLAFSFCGALLMTNFTNLVMLFLAIEILSIPVYVLAASNRSSLLSNESGFKYFILGSAASAILLFGIALLYGATGSFDLYTIHDALMSGTIAPLSWVGLAMILTGFGFKISVAPFHFWAPDVYQGAPTPITGWMATVVKGAAIFGMYRLFKGAFDGAMPHLEGILVIIIAITLVIANGMASIQSNVKRMLAYSGVSHAAFMLATMIIPGFDPQSIVLYVISYGISSLIVFSIMNQVGQTAGEELNNFRSLSQENPFSAAAMTIGLLSMAGIPPLAGFFGKYYVISGLISSHPGLTIIMVLTSVVGMYYYLKVIFAMYQKTSTPVVVEENNKVVLSLGIIALVAMMVAVPWM